MTILSKLQLWNYMFQDMKEPVSYLPQAILIGLAAAAAGSFLLFAENRIKKGRYRAAAGVQEDMLFSFLPCSYLPST